MGPSALGAPERRANDARMEILVVESAPHLAESIRSSLTSAGHSVATCTGDDVDGPCRSLANGVDCPLGRHVDVAVLVRDETSAGSLDEMGAICAQRHRVPMTVVDPSPAEGVTELVERAATAGRERLEATSARLVEDAIGGASATVRRSRNNVRVTLSLPATSDMPLWKAVDTARAVIREFDPYVAAIDIDVADAPSLPA